MSPPQSHDPAEQFDPYTETLPRPAVQRSAVTRPATSAPETGGTVEAPSNPKLKPYKPSY